MIGDNNVEDDFGRNDLRETDHFDSSAIDVTNNQWQKCVALKESESDITTQEEFYKFDFQVKKSNVTFFLQQLILTMYAHFQQKSSNCFNILFPCFFFVSKPNWLRNKEFWDMSFETRYEKLKRSDRPNLRVFITPFSHNDPG